MTISLSKDEVAKLLKAKTVGDAKLSFRGVHFDSREISGGELFVARPGQEMHGHEFLPQAQERGAALFLVEDAELLNTFSEPERLLVVESSQQAFWDLAAWWREQLQFPVLGITGSVGKTTVKELAARILLTQSVGIYSLRSHNNEVGLPYTVCRADREHEWAVFELGMNAPGEMTPIARIAKPDVALITSVCPAHLEAFDSVDAIADAKFEILEGVRDDGLLLLNSGDDVSQRALQRHPRAKRIEVRYFGEKESDAAFVSNIRSRGLDGIAFTLSLDGDSQEIEMAALGRHNALNVAAAALGVRSLFPDFPLESIVKAVSQFAPPVMRMNLKHLDERRCIIDDSYNANPVSMRAALKLAADLSATQVKVGLVLGEMLELGATAAELHAEVGELAAEVNPQFLIVVGDHAAELTAAVKARSIPYFEVESALAAAHTAAKLDYDVLLVKGSRGNQLDKTVETLIEASGGEFIPQPLTSQTDVEAGTSSEKE